MWDAAIGEILETASDDREEAKEYGKYAVGLYKKDILVGHIPIEISSLCFHFINQDPGNKIKALSIGKRQREIGLVVLAKLIFITNNKRSSEVLENELHLSSKIYEERCILQISFLFNKIRKTQLMFCFFLTGVQLLEYWRHITVCFE